MAAFSGPFKIFGIIGIRQSRGTRPIKSFFAKRHCGALLYLNNEVREKADYFLG